MTEGRLRSENTAMNRRTTAVLVAFGVGLLLFRCSEGANPEVKSAPPLDQMPLMLAGPLFETGYELAGYYELDTDGDGIIEALAVLTLRRPMTEFSTGSSRVLLFGQHGGVWSLNDRQRLDGANASMELRDLTGDGFPELLIFTEEVDSQLGDFVVPLRHSDHLSVFTYTPGLHLAKLGTFSSSLSGEMRPRSAVSEWEGRPAIQTARDLPPVGGSLWQPFRVETFAWDGQGFVNVDVGEERRISPIVSWLVRRNAPWAVAFLALGGAVSVVVTTIARRSRLRERWIVLGVILLFIAGGVGLGSAEAWLCVPALVLIALAGFWVGRQVATRLPAGNLSTKPTPAPEDEASAFRTGSESGEANEGDSGA
jgi:hypothetical protein